MDLATSARTGGRALKSQSEAVRSEILITLARLLVEREEEILGENGKDLEIAANR